MRRLGSHGEGRCLPQVPHVEKRSVTVTRVPRVGLAAPYDGDKVPALRRLEQVAVAEGAVGVDARLLQIALLSAPHLWDTSRAEILP
jgi:hypothetical protein